MNSALAYSVNRAGAMQIATHLRACDAAFVPPLSERVDIDEYAHKLADRAERFEAWAGDLLVGLVVAYCNGEARRHVFISSVSVLSVWRGTGVASYLLERCLAHAEAFGAEHIELEVGRGNAHAIRLYERFGFTAAQAHDKDVLSMNRGRTDIANKRVLIFPAGMPRSLAYLDQALANGMEVVGSSSLGHDPARVRYPRWVQLPYVTTPEFDQALRQAITAHSIGRIYTPSPVVWDYLHRRLGTDFPGVTLVNSSPLASEMAPYTRALSFAQSVLAQPFELAASGKRQSVAAIEIAALFRHAETIPGMCDQEKIRALCEVFRYCPTGDVVEIGSWWGKSAFVLARLARCYGTGKLLCIDPWTSEHLVQENKSDLIDYVAWDAGEALTVFQLNLLPYASGAVNYLRLPSVAAALEYRRHPLVETELFGRTQYAGKIALLHIDGNHGYADVRADMDSWCDLVVPGGWIVMDDYAWVYGDGPRCATDEFLALHAGRVTCAFFAGGALFIQMSAGAAG